MRVRVDNARQIVRKNCRIEGNKGSPSDMDAAWVCLIYPRFERNLRVFADLHPKFAKIEDTRR